MISIESISLIRGSGAPFIKDFPTLDIAVDNDH